MTQHNRRKKVHTQTQNTGHGFTVDYKDVNMLKGYVNETGKIVPCRITGGSSKFQRAIARAIKQARFIALMPYCDSHR